MRTIFKIGIGFAGLLTFSIAYWLISPLFINKIVSEKVEDIQEPYVPAQNSLTPQIIAQGNFMDADSFHKIEGTAQLLKLDNKYFIRFEENFKATNGPDLFVHFGKNSAYAKEAKISALKGNIGSQNYEVPADINPLDYTEVWIWCRAFSVPFGHAILQAI